MVKKKKEKAPKKVLINVKILEAEKIALKGQAKRYAKGNVTRLFRLVAAGKFVPAKLTKAA